MNIRSLSSFIAITLIASPLVSLAQAPAAAPADTNAPAAAPVAPVAPTGSTAPAAPTSEPGAAPTTERPSTYTIAQGDSLWTIAHKYGTTVVALRKANNLKKGALLHPGQVLQIPPAKSEAATK